MRVVFPDCVDLDRGGRPLLDSANHRSYMTYSRPIDGTVCCPRWHPRSVPVLTMNATFPIPSIPGKVTLSCGENSFCNASSMHADFFNAWEERRLAELVERCINAAPFTASNPKPAECQVTGT